MADMKPWDLKRGCQNRQKRPKFVEMRDPLNLPFYKKYLKMLKRPKKQPFSELSGKYPGNRGWKPA